MTRVPNLALSFDETDGRVDLPFGHDSPTPITIEAFVTFHRSFRDQQRSGAFVANNERGGVSLDIDRRKFNFLMQNRTNSQDGYARASSEGLPRTNHPVHVAGVFDGTHLRLFVGGRVVATTEVTGTYQPSKFRFLIGGSADDSGIDYPFVGTVDEVRISDTARYESDFEPLRPFERHSSDGNTLGLYHCDEGVGEKLTDSSEKQNHGTIVGHVEWVRRPGLPPRIRPLPR